MQLHKSNRVWKIKVLFEKVRLDILLAKYRKLSISCGCILSEMAINAWLLLVCIHFRTNSCVADEARPFEAHVTSP